tara:strand:+ start:49 stop:822 length:774 start_codon:yes stop_codon:yes gene_type:complete
VINRVKTFTKEDCNKIETTVDSLDKLWINRSCTRRFSYENKMHISRAPFWTLGAVSYLDHVKSGDQYDKHRDYVNPVLYKKFNWIYEIITKKLQEALGEPVVIDKFLAHPGFHIFATKIGTTIEPEYMKLFEQPLGSVHVDVQWEEHHDYWQTFDEVNLKDTLSFTVPIKLPSGGGGLYTWADEVNPYSFNYTTNEVKLSELEHPCVSNLYTEGEMIYFIGHLLHQMMPGVNVQPTDRRITVQGHGQKCDGVWRLYW